MEIMDHVVTKHVARRYSAAGVWADVGAVKGCAKASGWLSPVQLCSYTKPERDREGRLRMIQSGRSSGSASSCNNSV
jgi:hypothetical protein